MYYVYILISKKDKNMYIGSTPDLKRRLTEHNAGKSFATAPRRPFMLFYYEAYLEKEDAVHREYALKKHGQARRHLMTRIKTSLRKAKT